MWRGNILFSKWNIFEFMLKLPVYYGNTWPFFLFCFRVHVCVDFAQVLWGPTLGPSLLYASYLSLSITWGQE